MGEWDVRALVGHTSRSFLTVEAYLNRPAAVVEVNSAADYFRSTSAISASPAVAERGRDAGTALGSNPATAVAEIAARVLTADLATALGEPLHVPTAAAAQALSIITDLALTKGLAGPLLLAATGRPVLPTGFSVL